MLQQFKLPGARRSRCLMIRSIMYAAEVHAEASDGWKHCQFAYVCHHLGAITSIRLDRTGGTFELMLWESTMSPNCTIRWPPSIPRWHLTTTHMCRFRSGSRPMPDVVSAACGWETVPRRPSTERGRGKSAQCGPWAGDMRSPSFVPGKM